MFSKISTLSTILIIYTVSTTSYNLRYYILRVYSSYNLLNILILINLLIVLNMLPHIKCYPSVNEKYIYNKFHIYTSSFNNSATRVNTGGVSTLGFHIEGGMDNDN